MILVPRLKELLKKWEALSLKNKKDFILSASSGGHFTYDYKALALIPRHSGTINLSALRALKPCAPGQ